MDYIFVLRKIKNSPWPKISHEIMATPVSASIPVWNQFCSTCDSEPYPFPIEWKTDIDSSSCSGIRHCSEVYSSQKTCLHSIDLTHQNTSCLAISSNFDNRMATVGNKAAVIYGKVLSRNETVMKNDPQEVQQLLSVALPLSKNNRRKLNVLFSAYCQVSGTAKFPSNNILFSVYESDCFYSDSFDMEIGKDYLIFIGPTYTMTAAPIRINEQGIQVVKNSCTILPPTSPIYATEGLLRNWLVRFIMSFISDLDYYESLCPYFPISSELCLNDISVSEIEYKEPSTPVTNNDLLVWWQILLVIIAVVIFITSVFFIIRISIKYFRQHNSLNRQSMFVSDSHEHGGSPLDIYQQSASLLDMENFGNGDDTQSLATSDSLIMPNSTAEVGGSLSTTAAVGLRVSSFGLLPARRVRGFTDERRTDDDEGSQCDEVHTDTHRLL